MLYIIYFWENERNIMHESIVVKGKEYAYATHYKDNRELRYGLNDLTRKTFGFDFEQWYLDGYWKERYMPYSLMDSGTVIANVSVNILDFLIAGIPKRYIQIGTVMTDEKYRGRGLCRVLMEKVLDEWEEKCDLIYLFANDSVVEFYPRFGFIRAEEYQCCRQMTKNAGAAAARKLDMSCDADKKLLFNTVSTSLPYAKAAMLDNVSLVMFYCTSFLKNNVYYIDACDTAVIARHEGETLLLLDIFCTQKGSLDCAIETMMDGQTRKVILGFTPLDETPFESNLLHEENTTLFIRTLNENPFATRRFMFPVLSHT